MQKRTLFYSLGHLGFFVLGGFGFVMNFPLWFFSALALLWFGLCGWTLAECKIDIINGVRWLCGKPAMQGLSTREYEVISYWDETGSSIEDALSSVKWFRMKRFPKTIHNKKIGEIIEISHPDGKHWSNRY
ncbi:MAG: hypothetical protein OXC41_01805 [Gammaproteobacteria bacterium]|nr:hypothetical protein [Gammaproteobacteria bacterium]